MTIEIPVWLLWVLGTVGVIVAIPTIIFFVVSGVIVFSILRHWGK